MSLRKISNLSKIGEYIFRENDDTPHMDDILNVLINDGGVYKSSGVRFGDFVNSFPMGLIGLIDEDDMSSNSDQHVPTQQSVKEYVDNYDNISYPSNSSVHDMNDLSNGIEYTNNSGRRLMVVVHSMSTNDLQTIAYIGETSANIIVSKTFIVSDKSNRSDGSTTFIVPNGWKYKVTVTNGGLYGLGGLSYLLKAQCWEI